MALNRIPSQQEQTNDPQIDRIQNNIGNAARLLNALPFRRGVQVGPLAFTAGGTQALKHRLNRVPSGWFPLSITGGYGVFQQTAVDKATLTIQSQNACTATFWVYL